MLNVKRAAIRAVRTAAQAAAGVLSGLALASMLGLEIAVIGSVYLAAVLVGVNAGVISFLQNVAEDNTAIDVPKG